MQVALWLSSSRQPTFRTRVLLRSLPDLEGLKILNSDSYFHAYAFALYIRQANTQNGKRLQIHDRRQDIDFFPTECPIPFINHEHALCLHLDQLQHRRPRKERDSN